MKLWHSLGRAWRRKDGTSNDRSAHAFIHAISMLNADLRRETCDTVMLAKWDLCEELRSRALKQAPVPPEAWQELDQIQRRFG